MRQAGILAACGIISLTKMVDRLADDHRRARSIAQAISELPGFAIDWDRVQTNMVLVLTDAPAPEVQAKLEDQGILCFPVAANRLRLVLHADIDDEKLDRAITAFQEIAVSRVS